VYVNAGGGPARDSIGRSFEGDDGYFTGGTAASAPWDGITQDWSVRGTYRTGGSFSFSKPVANGNYDLFLTFIDPTSQAAGERLFDVSAEGKLALDNFDVFAAVDPATRAVAKKFGVTIADGTLDLDFTGVVGDAIVSSVVLVPTDIPIAMIPYSGIGDYPNSPQHEAVRAAWSIRSASNLRMIGQGLFEFVSNQRGRMPADFTSIMHWSDIRHEPFANPRIPTLLPRGDLSRLEMIAWVEQQTDYIYVDDYAGQRITVVQNPAATIIAYENPDATPADVLNALYLDGHVAEVSRAALVAQFGGATTAPPESPRPMQTAADANVWASQQNLRTLSQALLNYSNSNRGRMPTSLGLLYPFYNVTADVFRSPRTTTAAPPADMTQDETRAWIDATTDYTYLGAGRTPFRTPVLAYETPSEMATGINILFNDGHVEFREMRWALETIAAARAYMASLP
jgi:prepilin-type processing-associated H-X9-DG protein